MEAASQHLTTRFDFMASFISLDRTPQEGFAPLATELPFEAIYIF